MRLACIDGCSAERIFERIAKAVSSIIGESVERPEAPSPLRVLTSGSDAKELRAIVALKALGALEYTGEEAHKPLLLDPLRSVPRPSFTKGKHTEPREYLE